MNNKVISKGDLKCFITEDARVNGVASWKEYIKYRLMDDERARAVRYLKVLRKQEYYYNNIRRGIYYRVMHSYYCFLKVRLGSKYHIRIVPNTVGYGLRLPHLGQGVVINAKRLGNYCLVNSGALIGKKYPERNAVIGNNVDIGPGALIIGDVTIGDNCIIGAGSVVVKDVPANSVVAGNPARVLRQRSMDEATGLYMNH